MRVNGPKGELSERIHRDITVAQEDDELLVTRPTDRGEHRALHGLTRSLVANMVEGVTDGYEKTLEIQGVGYRAALKGKDLELALGYSHPVPIKAPDGIEFEVPQPTRVIVRASPSSRSARSPPTSASSGRRSPTRARASATRASTSPGRSASAHERPHEARSAASSAAAACARRSSARAERPRISVFRSNRGIPAQLVDDVAGRTLAAVVVDRGRPARAQAAWSRPRKAGELLAERAKAAGVERAVFDRGGYQYHGRVKAFAEGVREGGLDRLKHDSFVDRIVSPAGLDLQERVVEINRVAKVVKGGRRFSFTALVVVGDEKDVVGVGYGKANEVPLAIQKGVERAKKNLFRVPKHGSTITHQTTGIFGSGRVLPEAGLARYRRHRRRRRARGARAGRHPRHPVQVARHAEPDQPRQGDGRRPAGPAHARRRSPSCAACRSTRSSACGERPTAATETARGRAAPSAEPRPAAGGRRPRRTEAATP